ncbi:leptin receptor [Rhinophrynus dorsalis]
MLETPLIDHKNLPIQEELFFLHKYVSGPAKRAAEGYFLVGTETAYHAAWKILDDRFGSPFIVGRSYHDKIQAWHKIATKDNKDLCEFVDFLSNVESAMPYVQGLQALNDCVENQRIAAKLPEWLNSRWNRVVTKFQDECKRFPDFRYFVELLNKEVRIACNPITSLQAIRPTEQERSKQINQDYFKSQRNHNSSAKTFTTSSNKIGVSHRIITKQVLPADHASRGLTARQLVESNWFTGPSFVWQRELPKEEDIKVGKTDDGDLELKRAQVHTTKAKEERSLSDRLQRFSDWKRVVKAIDRHCAKCVKGLKERSNEPTTLEERKFAEQFIIPIVQVLSDEIRSLKQGKEVNSNQSNKLYKLSLLVDDHDILRVGGRLTKAALHPHVKHPAILPKGHHVSRLLIKHFHERIHHQGRGMTINEICSNGIWILGCSTETSSLIYKFIKCRKLRKCNQEQKMTNLPPERMETIPPFTYSGVNCFGPFYVKDGRKEQGRYGLLFTCMCSRAVHLEVLDDLRTDAFLNTLCCFISIRGNVSQLHSDQDKLLKTRHVVAQEFDSLSTMGIPPSDFLLSCVLPNKSSNYPLEDGILENMSDFSQSYDLSSIKRNITCTYMTNVKTQKHVSCCIWDHLNIDSSGQSEELRRNILSTFASNLQLVDFSFEVQCSVGEDTSLLICDMQLVSEMTQMNKDYRARLHHIMVSNDGRRVTTECECLGYEKCQCFVPYLMFTDSYMLWLEILNDMMPLQSPLLYVTPSHIVKPDPPDNLQVEITEQGALKVMWSKPPSAVNELQYLVKQYLNAAENDSQVYLLVKETSVIIDDIHPCSQLVIKVRCKSLYGPGVWSDWSRSWVLDSQDVFYFPQKVLASSGSNASVYCFYCDRTKKAPSQNIMWWINLSQKIPEHQYTAVSDYTGKVSLVHLNATKPKGKFHYDALHCCLNNNECHHRYAEIYVIDVNIEISCETNGKLTMMTCRWSTKNITLLEESTVQLKYYRNEVYCPEMDIVDNKPISKECQLQKDGFYECTFQPIYLKSGYTMWLEIQHYLGTLHSPPMCVIPIDIVKPFAPSRIKAEITEGTGHLYVSWKRPALPPYDLQFQLWYCMQGEEIVCKVLDDFEGESASIQVLDSCALYTVQIRGRNIDGTGYWSNWSDPVYTLAKDIRAPLKGPEFWRIVQNDPVQKGDNITLIWQPLQKEYSLCSVKEYEVIHQTKNVSWSRKIGNDTKYTFTLTDDSITVTVVAVNSLGYSLMNNNLTISYDMSTVRAVQSLSVYLINSSCAVVMWTMMPMEYSPLELVLEWRNLVKDGQVRWMFIPSNVNRCYVEDHFFAIEKYQFSLYPVYPEGIGRPEVAYEFTKADSTEAVKDTGLYVILPIIILSSLLLMGTLVISHQRMKQMFWKDVPNPKHCSWAQGVNFQKPDTLENLFMKHHELLAHGPPFLCEPETVLDLSIVKELKNNADKISINNNNLFTVTEDSECDSACATSHFTSSSINEDSSEKTVYSNICQSSIKYATIINKPQQGRQYGSERKASAGSFDGCLLGNNAIVIGNCEMEKQAFLILSGLQTKQPNKMSSNSTVSSEGFSEPPDHDENFLDADSMERNIYYMGFASIQECEQDNYFSENGLVTYPFQENISYKEIDFMKDKSECLDSDYNLKCSVKKSFLSYMPQFQTHSIRLQGGNETELYDICT